MKTPHNDPFLYINLKQKALYNRKNPTYAEKLMWNLLRRNNLGVHFKRQHLIYTYIVDFVCLELGLIIEIDGSSHDDKIEYDELRTQHLEYFGFRVVRFDNSEIIEKGNLVESQIRSLIADLKI
ncbi:MAG: endonuclease domain-containing protein [Candidatus Kapaibacteriota bacterium]|jgi:5-methyltetrahydrofolate--homocysteine methyltransferase